MTDTDPTRDDVAVMVVDDQTLVRHGITTLLEIGGITVVAEASDGAEAMEALDEHAVDVILLDLRMPTYDGLWFLRELHERSVTVEAEPPPVLILTTFDDDSLVIDALTLGARGYMLKDVTVNQLSEGVHTLADGGTLIAPSITDRLLRSIRSGPSAHKDDSAVIEPLTTREMEVLRLMAEGYGNRQISEIVHLAQGTVKNHVSTILMKLGARDRTNAVLRALREGLLG